MTSHAWRTALLATLWLALPSRLSAQGILLDIGYVFRTDAADLASYRAAFMAPLVGPIRWGLAGELLQDVGGNPVSRWGAGVDLTAWRGGRGPFAALSLDGGVETAGPDDTWASWSAGLGYDFHLGGGVTTGADLRYRGFFGKEPGGVQVSASVAYWWGRRKAGGTRAEEPGAEEPGAGNAGADGTASEAGVVASARQALGKPYLYGGTGQGDDGFDCSGLIQYAYAQHGVALPRTSTAQATQGHEVDRSIAALSPGDILTFSGQPGGSTVTHVGLYLGSGRFIHSASSRGVMESTLSASDPNGQWWYARWVGARRVLAPGQ